MPGGIVEDEDVPFRKRGNGGGSLIEEDLENIGIAMACLNGEELPRAWTDSPEDSEADMIPVVDHSWSRSLDGPSPSRPRFPVYACFIPIPKLHIGIFREDSELGEKVLPEGFILSVRPGPRHFQDI